MVMSMKETGGATVIIWARERFVVQEVCNHCPLKSYWTYPSVNLGSPSFHSSVRVHPSLHFVTAFHPTLCKGNYFARLERRHLR